MIEDTLAEIEARLNSTEAIPAEKRRELQRLLATLKAEVGKLSKTHAEQAQSIAGFTQVSAHEATRQRQNPQLLNASLNGLKSSVEEFEKSHPKLVEIVNSISNTLANLGI
jgi:prefoldin subunit 5